ncbi:hypothetical protein HPP92_007585 [Vanilla planifolia]|uniref:Uncharacterized protein n=1 Tax=Vanilla planifolia TaxID=51239 RepID=A0A835RRG8_VANPL|nr:hypothetical protein HPP92_007585 [Vanilla planifolia]
MALTKEIAGAGLLAESRVENRVSRASKERDPGFFSSRNSAAAKARLRLRRSPREQRWVMREAVSCGEGMCECEGGAVRRSWGFARRWMWRRGRVRILAKGKDGGLKEGVQYRNLEFDFAAAVVVSETTEVDAAEDSDLPKLERSRNLPHISFDVVIEN